MHCVWMGGRLSYQQQQQQKLSWESTCMHYQQWCSQGIKERSLWEDHPPAFLSRLVFSSVKNLGWHSYNSQYCSQQPWVFGCFQRCPWSLCITLCVAWRDRVKWSLWLTQMVAHLLATVFGDRHSYQAVRNLCCVGGLEGLKAWAV